MRRLVLMALLAWTAAFAEAPFSHEGLDGVLQTRVDTAGRVDYAGLKADRAALDAYVDSLARTSPRNAPQRFADRAHELAYWINAYNAFVLRGVIDAYPVDSVKDIGLLSGFFNRKKFRAGGEELTLNDIENGIIRPEFREPRIHFAVNCGAVSCPPLAARAYDGGSLSGQLEQALERFAGDFQHVRLDARGGLHLSKILEWYGDDFVEWFPADRQRQPRIPAIVDYLLPYLPRETAAAVRQRADLTVDYLEYDWALNDRRPRD